MAKSKKSPAPKPVKVWAFAYGDEIAWRDGMFFTRREAMDWKDQHSVYAKGSRIIRVTITPA